MLRISKKEFADRMDAILTRYSDFEKSQMDQEDQDRYQIVWSDEDGSIIVAMDYDRAAGHLFIQDQKSLKSIDKDFDDLDLVASMLEMIMEVY